MSNNTPPDPSSKPAQRQISIEIPKSLDAGYANLAFITHTPAEVVIDFAQYLPRMSKGTVVSRIIMSPIHAKLLRNALAQNIAKYEQQFGEIRVPQKPTLADELFRFRPGEQEGDDEEEGK